MWSSTETRQYKYLKIYIFSLGSHPLYLLNIMSLQNVKKWLAKKCVKFELYVYRCLKSHMSVCSQHTAWQWEGCVNMKMTHSQILSFVLTWIHHVSRSDDVLLNTLQLQTSAPSITVAVTRTQTVTRRDCSSTAAVTVVTKETATPASPSTGGRGPSLSPNQIPVPLLWFSPLFQRIFYMNVRYLTSVCYSDVLKSRMVAAVTLPPASSLVQWVKTFVYLISLKSSFFHHCLPVLSGLRIKRICFFFCLFVCCLTRSGRTDVREQCSKLNKQNCIDLLVPTVHKLNYYYHNVLYDIIF